VNMKKYILYSLLVFNLIFAGISSADTIILNKKGFSTYIQEIEYPLSEGINDIGPIYLKPFANLRGLRIEGNGIDVLSYVVKNVGDSWKKKLLGKFVEIKGGGRTIKGKVMNINGKYIEIATKKGYVLTTLPKYPARISSPLSWQEIYSPQLDIRLKSNSVQTHTIRIMYPLTNVSWYPEYILKDNHLEIFITLVNNTPVSLENVNIKILGFFKPLYLKNKTLSKFSIKKIKIYSGKLSAIAGRLNRNDLVAVYRGNQFVGFKRIGDVLK